MIPSAGEETLTPISTTIDVELDRGHESSQLIYNHNSIHLFKELIYTI